MKKKNGAREISCFILFADICDATDLSNALSVKEYGKVVQQFNQSAQLAFEAIRSSATTDKIDFGKRWEFSVRGDEVCIIFHGTEYFEDSDIKYNTSADAHYAIDFAVLLNSHWLMQDVNKDRLSKNQLPLLISIGIHYGPVYYCQYQGDKWSSEGYSINLAKRIESAAKISNRIKSLQRYQPGYINSTIEEINSYDPDELTSRGMLTQVNPNLVRVISPIEESGIKLRKGFNSQVFISKPAKDFIQKNISFPEVPEEQFIFKGIPGKIKLFELFPPLPDMSSYIAFLFNRINIDKKYRDFLMNRPEDWIYSLGEMIISLREGMSNMVIDLIESELKENIHESPGHWLEIAKREYGVWESNFFNGVLDEKPLIGSLESIEKSIHAFSKRDNNLFYINNDIANNFIKILATLTLLGIKDHSEKVMTTLYRVSLERDFTKVSPHLKSLCLILQYHKTGEINYIESCRDCLAEQDGYLQDWRFGMIIYSEAMLNQEKQFIDSIQNRYNMNFPAIKENNIDVKLAVLFKSLRNKGRFRRALELVMQRIGVPDIPD